MNATLLEKESIPEVVAMAVEAPSNSNEEIEQEHKDVENESDHKDSTEEKAEEQPEEKEMPLWAVRNVPSKPLPSLGLVKLEDSMDPVEIIFHKGVLSILQSLDIPANRLAVYRVAELALEYLHELVAGLHKFVEIERRRKLSLRDVKLLMRQNQVSMLGLFEEYKRSNLKLILDPQLLSLVKFLKKNAKQTVEMISNPNAENDQSDPLYNQTFEILDLIPSTTKLRFPRMFPQLPPDYTYKKTAVFNKLVTDPFTIRERLAEESRYGERALENLVNGVKHADHDSDNDSEIDDDKTLVSEDVEMSNTDESLESKEHSNPYISLNSHSENPRAFDIEAFAKKRMEILNQRREKLKRELELRKEAVITKVSYELGAYTKKSPLKMKDDSVAELIDGYLSKEYGETLRSIKISAKKRLVRLKRELLKREKLLAQRELERQQNGIEQTFEFGNRNEEEEIDDFNFDFEDDDEKGNEHVVEGSVVQPVEINAELTPVVENNNLTSSDSAIPEHGQLLVSVTEDTSSVNEESASIGDKLDFTSSLTEQINGTQQEVSPKSLQPPGDLDDDHNNIGSALETEPSEQLTSNGALELRQDISTEKSESTPQIDAQVGSSKVISPAAEPLLGAAENIEEDEWDDDMFEDI